MKRFVVAYSDLPSINNHECLFPSFVAHIDGGPAEVILHSEPVTALHGNTLARNYDLLISPHPIPMAGERCIVLERYTKVQQCAMMMEFIEKHRAQFPNFIVPATWATEADLKADVSSYAVKNVIFKFQDGARGICQLLVENVANVNKSTLFRHFKAAMLELSKAELNAQDVVGVNKLIHEKLEKALGVPALWTGYEQRDAGYLPELLNPDNYYVQKYVDHLREEHRILVMDESEIHYFKRGVRADRPFPQATGGVTSIYSPSLALDDHYHTLLTEEIKNFLATFVPEMNSADLFVTQDGKYGLFEFCNQYGTDVDDPHIFSQIHRHFIIKHINRAIAKKLF